MFFGSAGQEPLQPEVKHIEQFQLKSWLSQHHPQIRLWHDESVVIWENETGVLCLDGQIWEAPRLEEGNIGPSLWQALKENGLDALVQINGDFSLFYWNKAENHMVLAVDKMGVGKCYIRESEKATSFGNLLKVAARAGSSQPVLHQPALIKYLMYNYNPGTGTFFKGVRRLRPGYACSVNGDGTETAPYWQIRFRPDSGINENEAAEGIRQKLSKAVRIRLKNAGRAGAFLSGGLDSSSVVSLLDANGAGQQQSFSFRCKGNSFDESPFAIKVSDAFKTNMNLVEYGADEASLAREMVQYMDEPFCDVGIVVGTYILSKAAAGKVDSLFTGDGGDELFAGHPVYTADNMAKITDRLPRFCLWPLHWANAILKDSDKKKDWRVKIKRFAESSVYPAALGTHRWRVYYTEKTLKKLLGQPWLEEHSFADFYGDLLQYNREGEGVDELSRSLYSDYQTAVLFYLRRMDLARGLGLSPRFPMLDPDLTEYCATLPSELKIQGMSDTKYIERLAVDPLLPHEVVHRKDKLGHSIPMKNWMRDHEGVIEFMESVLLSDSLEARGWFDTARIRQMMVEHKARKTNHSHRLWALMILELWLRRHWDDEG